MEAFQALWAPEIVGRAYAQVVRWEDGLVAEIRGYFDEGRARREYERLRAAFY